MIHRTLQGFNNYKFRLQPIDGADTFYGPVSVLFCGGEMVELWLVKQRLRPLCGKWLHLIKHHLVRDLLMEA
jgi:hypothetical protein